MSKQVESDINVLIVEDNPIDVRVIKLALKKAGLTKEPTVVDDGIPALALLRQENGYEQHSPPDLVILDLNLKRVDGPELLTSIRQTAELSDLCVMILSSWAPEEMVRKTDKANGYFTKPIGLEAFVQLVTELIDCYRQHCSSLSSRAAITG